MVVESICIAVILLIMFFGFLRSKHRSYAFATLSLVVLPILHLLGQFFLHFVGVCPQEYLLVALIIVDLVGLAAGCAATAMTSGFIEKKKNRIAFLSVCCVFIVALACAYVIDSVAHYAVLA